MNRLCVTRQVYCSEKNINSVDLVLVLNGIPFATMELKNLSLGRIQTIPKNSTAFRNGLNLFVDVKMA